MQGYRRVWLPACLVVVYANYRCCRWSRDPERKLANLLALGRRARRKRASPPALELSSIKRVTRAYLTAVLLAPPPSVVSIFGPLLFRFEFSLETTRAYVYVAAYAHALAACAGVPLDA